MLGFRCLLGPLKRLARAQNEGTPAAKFMEPTPKFMEPDKDVFEPLKLHAESPRHTESPKEYQRSL
jgi:hypothetical protein